MVKSTKARITISLHKEILDQVEKLVDNEMRRSEVVETLIVIGLAAAYQTNMEKLSNDTGASA